MADRSISSSSASFYEKPYEASEENTMRLYGRMRLDLEDTKKLMVELEDDLRGFRENFAVASAVIGAIHSKKRTSAEEHSKSLRDPETSTN